MAQAPSLPSTEESDSSDVRWALETAQAVWTQGDSAEALRWLKRAAESASEEGDDMRSLTLAKAAAELRNYVEQTGAPAPSTAPAPSAATPGPTSRGTPSAPPLGRGSVEPPSPFGGASLDHTPALFGPVESVPPPSSGGRASPAAALDAGYRGSDSRPSRPSGRPDSRPSGAGRPTSDPGRRVATARPAPLSSRNAMPPSADPEEENRPTLVHIGSSRPPPAHLTDSKGPRRRPPPPRKRTLDGEATEGSARHEAVRVSIHPVEGQRGVFLTRLLAEGERPLPGAREALLVALESGVGFVDDLSGSN
jgi:hypothetical protein